MDLAGKKAAVLVEQMYQELEVWYPYYRLREAGVQVDLVGPEAGVTYPSKLGYPARADRAAGRVSAQQYDAIVIPGGYAPDYMRRCQAMIDFAQAAVDARLPIAAICHGPWLLCSTSGLRGRRATCFMAIRDDVRNAGAEYLDAECVVDGNLITARKPDDLPAFCRALLAALAGPGGPGE
ncbi:MAG: type 1 glutamine amidotransferase [Sedimentisphaerales bacterium]|nr:type 1 glutamine amidotransferase [Sedimentisphaerales bacterium]